MADDVSIKVGLEGSSEVQQGLRKIEGGFEELQTKAVTIGAALGTAIGQKLLQGFDFLQQKITQAVVGTAQLAGQLEKLQKQTGLSVKTLQELRFAAQSVNVPFESLTSGFRSFARDAERAAQGNKAAVKEFEALGVSVKDASGKVKDANTLYIESLRALGQMEDGFKKTSIAAGMFGASAKAQLAIASDFDRLKETAARLGVVMDDLALQKAAKLDQAFTNLAAQSEVFWRSIAEKLIPTLLEFLNTLDKSRDPGDRFVSFMRTVANIASSAPSSMGPLSRMLDLIALGFNKAASAADAFASSQQVAVGKIKPAAGPDEATVEAMKKLKLADEAVRDLFESAGDKKARAFFGTRVELEQLRDRMPELASVITPVIDRLTHAEEAARRTGNQFKETKESTRDLLEPLKNLRDQLQGQVETFGMSEAAAMRWRVTHGDLGRIAGVNAAAIRDEVVAMQDRLDILKRNKEQAEEVRQAYLKEAAAAEKRDKEQVDFVNKKREEVAAFERSVDPIKVYLSEVEKINELYQKWELFTEAAQKAQVKLAEGLQKTLDAADPMKAMFDELIRAVEGFGKKFTENITDFLVEGKLEIGNFTKEVHRLITNMLINTFVTKPIQDFATDMIKILKDSSGQMEGIFGGKINSGFGASMLGKAFGGGGGGGGGDGFFSGMIPEVAGMFAGGGVIPAGFSGIVGEQGPELITPASRSRITPNDQMGGGSITVNNHFHDVGNMDMKNQGALAARAGESVNRAIRKNR